MEEPGEATKYVLGEAGNVILKKLFAPSAGVGGVFAVLGLWIYSASSGTLRCDVSAVNGQYDGRVVAAGGTTPIGCSKVTELPVLGKASSLAEAAGVYGVSTAILAFLVIGAVLMFRKQ